MFTPEQQMAINYDSGNVLVSASAGSGKTSVMIERLSRLIASGKATISEILAVTFTEASALEMKERIKRELSKRVSAVIDSNGGLENDEVFSRLEEQIADIRSSDISTIDSFCSRLVRSYFYEVGISPDYEIAEGNKASALKEEALDLVFQREYKNGGAFLKYIDFFQSERKDKGLREIISSYYEFTSTESDMLASIDKYKGITFEQVFEIVKRNVFEQIATEKAHLEICLSDCENNNLSKGKAFINLILSRVNEFLSGNDIYQINKLTLTERFSFDSSKDEFALDIKERTKKARDNIKEIVGKYVEVLSDFDTDKERFNSARQTADFIFDLTVKFSKQYDSLKRDENLLDFADLEHFALKILENQTILESIKEKYKYIFIDEYQDVNSTQEEIISRLSKDNCFMVGDEKQSIYGFRGCRPEFFNAKYVSMQKEGGNCVKLNNNFRSADAVIKMVNDVFSFAMQENRYGLNYQKDACLISGDGYGENKGRAELHMLMQGKSSVELEKPRIYDIKEEIMKGDKSEDDLTVSLLCKIINEELNNTYFDVKEQREKKVTKGDIVILTRQKKGDYIDKLIKGLIKHGIDVCSSSEEDICTYPEVQNAIAILRLIDCFYQDIPLLSALKGHIVNCTENQLATIVDFYKENVNKDSVINKYNFTFSDAFAFYLKNADGELIPKLKSFVDYIEKIRFISDFMTAGEILEKIEEDFSIFAQILAEKCGDKKVLRLKRLISFCNENELSISQLIKIVDSGDKKITICAGGGESCVKLMTIHSSKGLEFPVVICCGLEKTFNSEEFRNKVFFDRDLGLGIKYYDEGTRRTYDTLLRFLIKENIYFRREREEMRLFYVALTRATYALHLTAVVKNDGRQAVFNGANKFLDYIPSSIPERVYTEDDLELENKRYSIKKVIISQENATDIERMKKRFSYVYPYQDDTTLALKSSVTGINNREKEEIAVNQLIVEDAKKSDAEKGIIAHRIMQYCDFNGDFDSQIVDMLNARIITQDELARIDKEKLKQVVESDFFKGLKDKKLYREQPFVVSVKACDAFSNVDSQSEILVQGIIDLLVIGSDGADIVDYKYSLKTGDALEKTYKKQLDIYALAVERILKIPVKSKKIISLLTGQEKVII